MKIVVMMALSLSANSMVLAAESDLPARQVESLSAAQAQSTAPVPAQAATASAPAPEPRVGVNDWLELQRSGRVASPVIQSQSAAERELANQRLLDSYGHAIPEFFDENSGGSASSQ